MVVLLSKFRRDVSDVVLGILRPRVIWVPTMGQDVKFLEK